MSSTSWEAVDDACVSLSNDRKSPGVTLRGLTELTTPSTAELWDCVEPAAPGWWPTVAESPPWLCRLTAEDGVDVTLSARSKPRVTGTLADSQESPPAPSISRPFSAAWLGNDWLGACNDMVLSSNDWDIASVVSITCLRDGGRRFDWIRARSYNVSISSVQHTTLQLDFTETHTVMDSWHRPAQTGRQAGRQTDRQTDRQTNRHSFNGLCSKSEQAGTRKVKPLWLLMKQEMMGQQQHQRDYRQIICTSIHTDRLQCFNTVGWASGRASGL